MHFQLTTRSMTRSIWP